MRHLRLIPPLLAFFLLSSGFASASATPSPASGGPQNPASPPAHVVILALENHSFDNIFGYYCDYHAGRCPAGGMPLEVNLSNGLTITPSVTPDLVPALEHNNAVQTAAVNHGLMNAWQDIVGPHGNCPPTYDCISAYHKRQQPNIVALANSYSIADRFFSQNLSASWGGHMAFVSGTIDGFVGDNPANTARGQSWGCDGPGRAPWQPTLSASPLLVPSCVPDYSLSLPNGGASAPTPVAHVPTIMDRLDAAGLPWKIYSASAPGVHGWGIWNICPTFAGCLDTSQVSRLAPDSQFLTDAASGSLPAFSIITPGGPEFNYGDHNGMSHTAADNWIGQIAQAAMTGPEASSTVLFITWDDMGGFYDHVPPGTNPDGTSQGPRVPLLIVSPYVVPRSTYDTPSTFASLLAFTENTFNLPPLGQNDAAASNFSSAFNYSQPPIAFPTMVTQKLPSYALRPAASVYNDPT